MPDSATCLMCDKPIGETLGFIRLSVGALFYRDRKRTVGIVADFRAGIEKSGG